VRLEIRTVAEETYTFTPNDGEPPVTIRSGALREWLHEHAMDKIIRLHFPRDETLDSMVERHGLEADRMASMTLAEAKEPVIVGLWGESQVLIDGGHRRWFWAKRGCHTLRGWAVPEVVWRTFLLDPNDFLVLHHHPDGSLLPHRRKVP
jgi:hypothetical protein